MDDINFEELDKAVNSVLKQPERSPSQGETFVSETPAEDADVATEPATPAVSPIVPKRRGQFMDMVHPSSDMTTSAAQRQMLPNRQTAPLQPLDPAIVETASQPPVEQQDVPAEEPASDVSDEVLASQTIASDDEMQVQPSEWPDPLDGMEEAEEDAQQLPEVDHDALGQAAHVEADFVSDEEGGAEESAANSPFIDGTEVEKRPLGAFADEVKTDEPVPEATEVVPDPLPQELGPEIVSVESDEGMAPQEAEPESQMISQDGMNNSIPQQYKAEEPLETDQEAEGHPVFDTKEYHQPLAPPARKSKASHVGRYVLAVFFVIVFGVAAGYVIWAFKLI